MADSVVDVNSGSSSLRDLVQQKEKEWKEAQELRIKSLETALAEKEKQLHSERIRFRKLKEDFVYNLKLVEERDAELERYDSLFSELKNIDSVRTAEVSELKIKLDDLKSKLEQEEKAQEDLKKHYQQRLREHQQELNQFRLAKEADVKKERDEYESFKREFQRRLRVAEEDVENQRRELMSGFDGALQKREHEFRLKLDEMSNSLLASELKIKMLTKELELVRASNEQTKDDLQNTTTSIQDLEKALKQKEWELMDERHMNIANVQELESKFEQVVQSKKQARESFQHKQAELDRYVREKEAALVASKQAHHERELKLEERIKELQSNHETQQVEARRLEWAHKDSLKEKEMQVQRLQNTVYDLQSKLESQSSEQSRSTVAKDLELEALRQQEDKMRSEIAKRKEDLDRYKRELTLALEREASLEQAKTQMEVDWQRRCEDTEREVLGKQEELMTNLAKARDEAVALAKDRERHLTQQEHFIHVLRQSRDEAIATLQRHGLSIPTELPSRDLGNVQEYDFRTDEPKISGNESVTLVEKVRVLEEQNAGLRGVIRQMRQEMEELTNQQANRSPSVLKNQGDDENGDTSVPLTVEYVKSLESEIRGLRSKNRSLTQRVEELVQAAKPSSVPSDQILKNKIADPYIQTHIKELNDTIGALRQEKLDLQAQVRKHQATVAHMQGLLTQCQEEVRQKQLVIDQLKYELSTEGRRHIDQLNANKQKIANLELQLAQVRHEADEYYKTGLQRNLEATSLGNQVNHSQRASETPLKAWIITEDDRIFIMNLLQVSSLKLHLASHGQTDSTHFSPQAAIIQRLQDEVLELRSRLLQSKTVDNSAGPSLLLDTSGDSGAVLRAKLKSAAQRISQLARDKEQLIQMGNRLRAELARSSGTGRRGLQKDDRPTKDPASVDQSSNPQYGTTKTSNTRIESVTPSEIADQLQGQLSAVEKLQYRLTTHELKYAKQQAQHEQNAADKAKVTVVASSSSSENSASLDKRGSIGPISTETAQHPPQLNSKTNSVPQASHSEPAVTSQLTTTGAYGQALFTSSSEGQSSLQEIWKLLDEEESFRSSTPGDLPLHLPPRFGRGSTGRNQAPFESLDFAVKGQQTATKLKPRSKRPDLSRKASGKAKFTSQNPRIRNYNVRDNG